MTASVFREDIEKCFACGMTAHLSKPLDIDAVFKIVRPTCLKRNGAGCVRASWRAAAKVDFVSSLGHARGR